MSKKETDFIDILLKNIRTSPNLLFHSESAKDIHCIVRKICLMLSNDTPGSSKNNILLVDCIFNPSIINIRNNVQQFIKSNFSRKQGSKIIIFDHLDKLSEEAQCALRVLMEQNNSNLFIGIASNVNNVVAPILSRMMSVYVGGRCHKQTHQQQQQSRMFCRMHYNPKVHWLFNIGERNVEIIMTMFEEIVAEIVSVQDHIVILEFFNELCSFLCDKHGIKGDKGGIERGDDANYFVGDLEAFVDKLLIEHVLSMEKIRTLKQ